MQEVPIPELKKVVEDLHDCKARHTGTEHVTETFQGETVWDGPVAIFALEGHPSASICYAWSSPVQRSLRTRFFAVLHFPPVESPQDAVRASIATQFKNSL